MGARSNMSEPANVTGDSITAESLIQRLQAIGRNQACEKCGKRIRLQASLLKLALGSAGNRLCFECVATTLDTPADLLQQRLDGYIERRECFRKAWRWAVAEDESET